MAKQQTVVENKAEVVGATAQAEVVETAEEKLARIEAAEREQRMKELLEKEAKLNKIQDREKRYAIRIKLLLKKAQAAGIKVSDAEIDAEMKKK